MIFDPFSCVLVIFITICCLRVSTTSSKLRNVLLIISDDLRPQLGAYGLRFMHTPRMDRLASEGVLFEHAYVQQAICSPTRNSFLSGRYPDKTLTWNFLNNFREKGVGADWTALPEFFRNNGYFTTGAGKVYHPNHPPNNDNAHSWSVPWPGNFGNCGCGGSGFPPGGQATCENMNQSALKCDDDKVTQTIVNQLKKAANGTLGNGSQPWFIGAGLHKPHLPFYAPQKYFNMYKNINPPVPLGTPTGMPYSAWHSCLSRSSNASDYSDWGNFTDIPNDMSLTHPMDTATAAHLRRGYYASVSYTDTNVGFILDAAESMRNNTVVILIGDHGWSLGEQNVWCKMTNFENGVRIPMIVRAPWKQAKNGMRVSHLVEAVDLYRTLADLSGIGAHTVESGVDGVSLMPLIINSSASPVHRFARSQFPRCYTALENTTSNLPQLDRTDCQDVDRRLFDLMGYSIRTEQWRFTEWRLWDGKALKARWDLPANATELYDHRKKSIRTICIRNR